jgi:hypothetical protein
LSRQEALLNAGISHQIGGRIVLHLSYVFQDAIYGLAVGISAVTVKFARTGIVDDIRCDLALGLLLMPGDAIFPASRFGGSSMKEKYRDGK